MDFDWDDANIGHIARHDVTVSEVEQVFAKEPEEEFTHTTDAGEDRYLVQGVTDAGGN